MLPCPGLVQHWRTWAAVTIQLAWRRYKTVAATARPRKQLVPLVSSLSLPRPGAAEAEAAADASQSAARRRDKLRMYTAMFTSPKPQD